MSKNPVTRRIAQIVANERAERKPDTASKPVGQSRLERKPSTKEGRKPAPRERVAAAAAATKPPSGGGVMGMVTRALGIGSSEPPTKKEARQERREDRKEARQERREDRKEERKEERVEREGGRTGDVTRTATRLAPRALPSPVRGGTSGPRVAPRAEPRGTGGRPSLPGRGSSAVKPPAPSTFAPRGILNPGGAPGYVSELPSVVDAVPFVPEPEPVLEEDKGTISVSAGGGGGGVSVSYSDEDLPAYSASDEPLYDGAEPEPEPEPEPGWTPLQIGGVVAAGMAGLTALGAAAYQLIKSWKW